MHIWCVWIISIARWNAVKWTFYSPSKHIKFYYSSISWKLIQLFLQIHSPTKRPLLLSTSTTEGGISTVNTSSNWFAWSAKCSVKRLILWNHWIHKIEPKRSSFSFVWFRSVSFLDSVLLKLREHWFEHILKAHQLYRKRNDFGSKMLSILIDIWWFCIIFIYFIFFLLQICFNMLNNGHFRMQQNMHTTTSLKISRKYFQ